MSRPSQAQERRSPAVAGLVALLAVAAAGSVAADGAPSAPRPAEVASAFTLDDVALTAGETSPQLTGVRVRIELLAEESRKALNGQSAELLLDADCDARRVRLRRVTVYHAEHQAGPGAAASAPPDWVGFGGHSYAAQIAEGICARRGELAAAADGDGPAAGPRTAPVAEPAHPAPARAAPSPMSSPMPPPIPPTSPPGPPPTAPALSRATPPAPMPGGVLVQYRSSLSQSDIDRTAARIRDGLSGDLAGLTLSTQTATLRGHTYYRGRIGPFATLPEARTFCVKLRRLGLSCLPLTTGPTPPRQGG